MIFVIARSRLSIVFDRINEVRWQERTKIRGTILQLDGALTAQLDFKPSSASEIILAFVQDYFQSIIKEASDWYNISASTRMQKAMDNC